jgi:hypothetical protein
VVGASRLYITDWASRLYITDWASRLYITDWASRLYITDWWWGLAGCISQTGGGG